MIIMKNEIAWCFAQIGNRKNYKNILNAILRKYYIINANRKQAACH